RCPSPRRVGECALSARPLLPIAGPRRDAPSFPTQRSSDLTAVLMSVAGPPSKSTRPFLPPSASPIEITGSTNCATTCASSRGTDYYDHTAPVTTLASLPRRHHLD